jgi:hypothetical protein
MRIIPFFDSSNFQQRLNIGGSVYIFNFVYNTRGKVWTMNISDDNTNPLVSGVVLVLEHELISRFKYTGIMGGQMYVIDTTGGKNSILKDDFKNGILKLVYTDE